ncbi:MAG: GAF domain-containing protein [Pseudomonadota bacterium]|nr:GAF domain-containing protein [Pseudomonadota bacterium]
MEPDFEERRQAELDALQLDPFAETAFDDLTKLAADTFNVPMSTISIVDGERQWFKSRLGVNVSETPRALAFCDHTIRTPNEMFVVEDATQDERFASNPFVTGEPGLRFYAAAPLTLSSGYAIGTLCVMDTQPHQVDPDKLKQLRFMADQVVATLEARKTPSRGK